MSSSADGLYEAFKASDPRFDGRFFVGIASTGIYCRPVCRARPAKPENCTFYSSAAEAENAGYRPCLLCRPELAPGMAISDASGNLARRAARILEETCGDGRGLTSVAEQLGCTDRHLRRVFQAEYNVTPVQYVQTCRLLLAKNLLTDTGLPVVDVAMAAGFGSLRRFNEVFKRRYHLAPTGLRKNASRQAPPAQTTVTLTYRPPYLWEEMLRFLAARAIPGVEVVTGHEYLRTVRIPRVLPGEGASNTRVAESTKNDSSTRGPLTGWIRVAHNPAKNGLDVTVSDEILPALPHVLARVKQLFDLSCDPAAVYATLEGMNTIRPGLAVLGTRVPGCFDPFEMAVRAVLGQQISVKAASTLAGRIVENYGAPVDTGTSGLTHVFPTAVEVIAMGENLQHNFGVLGVTSARSATIAELARVITRGEVDFHAPARPEEEIAKLMTIRGIGSWTAQYIAMRTMEWPDAFLETDVGVKKALPGRTPKDLVALAEAWRPWRSYATVNLWNSFSRS